MWKSVIKPALIMLAYVGTLITSLCLFVSDLAAVIIGLTVFCLSIVGFTVYLSAFIYKRLKRTTAPHIANANFIKWEFNGDGKKSVFEVFRHIQCKQPVMSVLDWQFKWTGSVTPLIESDIQEVLKIKVGGKNNYDSVPLQFKNPLFYNDTAVVHFRAKLDDTDNSASPHAEFKVEAPASLIQFRIILKHKSAGYNKSASFSRRSINGPGNEEVLASVPFDRNCKSYEYHLLNPDIGYYYRLKWEK